MAVNRFLELIGSFYAADRAYIFEYEPDALSNTFEWCTPGISRKIDNLQKNPYRRKNYWNC
ncbi:hypothetical protein [Neglectibacter timonensis]|uniref:hypothetical protein n=1 Tax=Neglectibacter timonensis TaxID=1776382 RepID=UPI00321A4CFC